MSTGVNPTPDPGPEDTRDETETSDPTPATLTGPNGSVLMTPPSEGLEPDFSTDAHVPQSLQQGAADSGAVPVHSLLIIEDDPWDAKLLEALLQGSLTMPVAFTHAGTLEEGMKEIQTQHVQLVLSDLQLPDSGVADTLPRLKEVAPDVPVIVLSGYADDALREATLAAGAMAYLVKGDAHNHAIITEIITQLDALPDLSADA